MKKIKQLVSQLSRYKFWLIISSSVLLIVLALAYGIIYGRLWLKLPAGIKADIAINRLGVSSYNDPICHESCFYERQIYKQVIAANLGREEVGDRVKSLILAKDNNLRFRLELLDALSLQDGLQLPDYLGNYLASGEEETVKEKIRDLFGLDRVSSVELADRLNNSSSTAERLSLLDSLRGKSDSSLADFYLGLVINEADLKVKNGALLALSNLNPSPDYISDDFLAKIRKTIFDPATDQYLRKELVLLLGDYLPFQEKVVNQMLVDIYSDEAAIDKFSRLFAAGILNRLSANSYAEPEISSSEWQAYREKNSLWGNE